MPFHLEEGYTGRSDENGDNLLHCYVRSAMHIGTSVESARFAIFVTNKKNPNVMAVPQKHLPNCYNKRFKN